MSSLAECVPWIQNCMNGLEKYFQFSRCRSLEANACLHVDLLTSRCIVFLYLVWFIISLWLYRDGTWHFAI